MMFIYKGNEKIDYLGYITLLLNSLKEYLYFIFMVYSINYSSSWFIYFQSGFSSEDEAINCLDSIVKGCCRNEDDTALIDITRIGNPHREIIANYRASFVNGAVCYRGVESH